MNAMAPPLPNTTAVIDTSAIFRLSVADYHEMGERGILTPEDRVELLDGYLVRKSMQKSPHGSTVVRLTHKLVLATSAGDWQTRIQVPVTLDGSEPEPDGVLARGDLRAYDQRHPTASDIGLVVEVSDCSLRLDRDGKGPIYARAGIPVYWLVNIPDARIEVYTLPSGPTADPAYGSRQDFAATDAVTLTLDGQPAATLAVSDILP